MSGALRKIAGNASKHNCTIIFLNQLRQKVGGWAAGGRAGWVGADGGGAGVQRGMLLLPVRVKDCVWCQCASVTG